MSIIIRGQSSGWALPALVQKTVVLNWRYHLIVHNSLRPTFLTNESIKRPIIFPSFRFMQKRFIPVVLPPGRQRPWPASWPAVVQVSISPLTGKSAAEYEPDCPRMIRQLLMLDEGKCQLPADDRLCSKYCGLSHLPLNSELSLTFRRKRREIYQ